MYPVTNAVKALYAAEQRQFLRITGTDRNGVAINITDANVVLGSFNIDRYSCNGNRLEVGTAIAAEMTVKLDNHAGTYNGIVFEGTELYVEIGIGNPVNWMPCGYFTPDEQPRTANQITIHALDRMVKFDNSVPGLFPWTTETGESMTDGANQPIYFMTDLVTYPATIRTIIQTICGYYNIPFTQSISSLPNYNYTISEAPNLQQPTTYRNVIQWCAGIMGTCAWIDWTGSLRFSWYGATTGYVSTPANRFSSDLHEDDVEITGIQYTNLQNYTVLVGLPEYTIDMTGNYLMAGNVTQILIAVNNRLNGYTYRPFSATIINAPYLWPMDQITFTDKDGNNHTCILTNVNFGINGAMSIEGKGESMQAASRDALSGMTKEQGALVEQAREATQQLNASLTQEEIFNRLTDNGAEQGLILYNGKVYLNASYAQVGTLSADRLAANSISVGKLTGTISNDNWVLDLTNGTLTIGDISASNITSGTINGDNVNAKLLSIVNEYNDVIASFGNVITLGKSDKSHAEMRQNLFAILDEGGDVYFQAGTFESSATINETIRATTSSQRDFYTMFNIASISSLTYDGTVVSSSNISFTGNRITLSNITLATLGTVVVYYTTYDPVYYFNLGTRDSGSTSGFCSVAEGYNVEASGNLCHAEGRESIASADCSHAEGLSTKAEGVGSHAEGYKSEANGDYSHAEGQSEANGKCSHAEGGSTANYNYSHAEGTSKADELCAHAEGYDTLASDTGSHAEGYNTEASGFGSHSEGMKTVASQNGSHAEGSYTTASGNYSHAEGSYTTASGNYSHAEGYYTSSSSAYQHVFGKYNVDDSSGTYREIVGNGTSDSNRANIRTLSATGNEWIAGTLSQGSDARQKDECGTIPDVSSIKAHRFKWNDNKINHDDLEHIGYYAQDVEEVAPYLVSEDASGNKSLDYIGFLCAKIEALEKRVKELERK